MLELHFIMSEDFNEETSEFETTRFTLHLEHSLVSLSKWESKYEKPFFSKDEKTSQEVYDYIEMMILDAEYPPDILSKLDETHMKQINDYFEGKHSATWFNADNSPSRSSEQVTSELIYFWLISYNIPIEVETWNLSRLFTLIRVFNVKSNKPKKQSMKNIAEQRRILNEKRRAEMNSPG